MEGDGVDDAAETGVVAVVPRLAATVGKPSPPFGEHGPVARAALAVAIVDVVVEGPQLKGIGVAPTTRRVAQGHEV